MKSIGERIKELRKDELGLSQAAFGAVLGISRDIVNNIENNRLVKPEQKEPLYKLICKEFGVSREWLETGSGKMFVTVPEEDEVAAIVYNLLRPDNRDDMVYKMVLSVVNTYSRLSPDAQAVIRNLIEQVLADMQKRED